MKIGMTYDLKSDYVALGYDDTMCAEFDSLETIDAIERFLRGRGFDTERIGNIKSLASMLVQGRTWDLVFNIAEGLHGRGREAQVPALLDAYQIPYVFSDALVLSLTLDKALTKRVVRDAGLATGSFYVLEDAVPTGRRDEEAQGAVPSPLGSFPLFVKPNADGTGKGITHRSLVHNESELEAIAAELLARFEGDVLVEQYLPGREFTVGIGGTGERARIIGVMEIVLLAEGDGCGYTFDNKRNFERCVTYALVDDEEAKAAGEIALNAWRVLGCRDGGRIDIRSDALGQPHFLEVNPLAGLQPGVGDLIILSNLAGMPYEGLLGVILDSALSDPQRFPGSLGSEGRRNPSRLRATNLHLERR